MELWVMGLLTVAWNMAGYIIVQYCPERWLDNSLKSEEWEDAVGGTLFAFWETHCGSNILFQNRAALPDEC